MASWLGLDPNCYTGADCWNYDHSDRGLLILAVLSVVAIIFWYFKK